MRETQLTVGCRLSMPEWLTTISNPTRNDAAAETKTEEQGKHTRRICFANYESKYWFDAYGAVAYSSMRIRVQTDIGHIVTLICDIVTANDEYTQFLHLLPSYVRTSYTTTQQIIIVQKNEQRKETEKHRWCICRGNCFYSILLISVYGQLLEKCSSDSRIRYFIFRTQTHHRTLIIVQIRRQLTTPFSQQHQLGKCQRLNTFNFMLFLLCVCPKPVAAVCTLRFANQTMSHWSHAFFSKQQSIVLQSTPKTDIQLFLQLKCIRNCTIGRATFIIIYTTFRSHTIHSSLGRAKLSNHHHHCHHHIDTNGNQSRNDFLIFLNYSHFGYSQSILFS